MLIVSVDEAVKETKAKRRGQPRSSLYRQNVEASHEVLWEPEGLSDFFSTRVLNQVRRAWSEPAV